MARIIQNSASRALLVRLLEQRLMTREALAGALGVGLDVLETFERGTAPMPPAAQLGLADGAARLSPLDPRMRRRAMALRSQVAAAGAYQAGATSRDWNAPVLPWWSSR